MGVSPIFAAINKESCRPGIRLTFRLPRHSVGASVEVRKDALRIEIGESRHLWLGKPSVPLKWLRWYRPVRKSDAQELINLLQQVGIDVPSGWAVNAGPLAGIRIDAPTTEAAGVSEFLGQVFERIHKGGEDCSRLVIKATDTTLHTDAG